ncbi:glutaredoxin 3 [Aliiglaciecola sp. CAU 1673]|uniref:glutaredoxin 3 n=1 Tax=Aliiglaciecola sp. CAU 1673 TaxID=3032595 RepID=UPI0023DA94E4|nr:glutaredoxin 3 [Aliiglaciecola sp. CAU 1673]MDF2178701.1 glutaredoxin 3 [Aliiglaciecola sp. CAU 1673]
MAKVEIYTKQYCPYCVRAKQLLNAKGLKFIEFPIDLQPELREEMISRANGGYTVPQIFINGRHIGGCDDMMALESQGKLDTLLADMVEC